MTYAEVVYMILDELKLSSDDSYFNEYHVLMLADKYRAMILKQRYKDIKKTVPYSNYQEVMFTLNKRSDNETRFKDLRSAITSEHNFDYIQGTPLETNYYFSGDGTKEIINDVETDNGEKILKRGFPMLINIGNPSVYLDDYNRTMINLVSREHGRYVGNNKYLRNVLYAFIEPNKGLYVKVPEGFKMKLNPANRETEVVEEGTINNPKRLLNVQGNDKYSFPSGINACTVESLNPDEGDFEDGKYYILPMGVGYEYMCLVKCIDTINNGLCLQLLNKQNNDLRKFDNKIVDDGEGNETVVVANEIPIKMVAVFEDSVYASEFTVEKELHPLDRTFPMEDSLVNLVIEAVVKELTYPVYRKEDTENNGTDTMPENQAVAPNNRR